MKKTYYILDYSPFCLFRWEFTRAHTSSLSKTDGSNVWVMVGGVNSRAKSWLEGTFYFHPPGLPDDNYVHCALPINSVTTVTLAEHQSLEPAHSFLQPCQLCHLCLCHSGVLNLASERFPEPKRATFFYGAERKTKEKNK